MPHMSEKEWQSFAASKNLDPDTGGEIKERPEILGITEFDVLRFSRQLDDIHRAIFKLQTYTVVGFALLAILLFIR